MGLRKSGFRSAEKAQTEQADQDQIDRDDDVEKTRNDENQNTGNERYDRLQMRNADGHDYSPFWLAMRLKTAGKPDSSTL
jgi:hypothetical protein